MLPSAVHKYPEDSNRVSFPSTGAKDGDIPPVAVLAVGSAILVDAAPVKGRALPTPIAASTARTYLSERKS